VTRSTRREAVVAGATGLLLGFGLDQLVGDPRRGHPVAGFGWLAGRLESFLYANNRPQGIAHVGILIGAAAGLGVVLEQLTHRRPMARLVATTAITYTVLGSRSLAMEATTVATQLAAGDVPAARRQITHLVGRDPEGLDAAELSRACVESVAENTSDAVVAPLFWGAFAGLPGMLAYRAVNTLDAMVGHRSERYRRFGWAAARLDDAVNWLPARLTAGLAAALGGNARAAVRIARRDARAHPSPNAGVVEASFAGALGLRVGGTNRYGEVVEDRGVLGEGSPPSPEDIARTVRLAQRIGLASAVLASAAFAAGGLLANGGTFSRSMVEGGRRIRPLPPGAYPIGTSIRSTRRVACLARGGSVAAALLRGWIKAPIACRGAAVDRHVPGGPRS
jgi:adenosylcobinamide-phosphate synthase